MVQLKLCGSHLTCKFENEFLNIRELVKVVQRNKGGPSLTLLPELLMYLDCL